MERLRYVARASGVAQDVLAREFAGSLGPIAHDAAELVTVCRRIVARHPTSGPLWWLCSKVLTSPEPHRTAWECADLLDSDRTARELGYALPDGSVVTVLGWPDLVARALVTRGDIEPLVVDTFDEGAGLVRRLAASDIDATEVPLAGLGAAVAASDLVLLEAAVVGPTHAIAVSSSTAAAAVAHHRSVPVWLTSGVGRTVSGPTWAVIEERFTDGDTAWDRPDELLGLDLVDRVAGHEGLVGVADLLQGVDTPVAPELFNPGIAL